VSSFVGLYTGLSGIRAAQTGIDVASHNVANSATRGYTRQRVALAASHSYQSPVGPIGTGVTVAQIGRLRDAFLDTRARGALAEHAGAGVRAQLLTTVEALTGEPDNGISGRLTALWTAAEAWANDPADPATRRQVISELGAVAETFRSVSSQWDLLEADARIDRETRITAANDALTALAELDLRIANADPKRVGNDLYDQRDVLLDHIAELTGATARVGADGRSEVRLAGVDLIDATGAGRLELDAAGSVLAVDPAGAATDTTGQLGGAIGGLTRFLDQDLPQWRRQLDALAAGLAEAVNATNAGGVRADGTPGGPLLSYDPADPAGSLARLTDDLSALAAAIAGAPPGPHDGTNAARFAALRTTPVDIGGTSATIDTHLSNLVTGLAGDVRSARTSATAARTVASSAATARDAEHGVSLDEEMVELVRYQRQLEASARVMTAVDQVLDTLVNRVGIVGR
jgi:flagellar hook-associated protein 1